MIMTREKIIKIIYQIKNWLKIRIKNIWTLTKKNHDDLIFENNKDNFLQ